LKTRNPFVNQAPKQVTSRFFPSSSAHDEAKDNDREMDSRGESSDEIENIQENSADSAAASASLDSLQYVKRPRFVSSMISPQLANPRPQTAPAKDRRVEGAADLEGFQYKPKNSNRMISTSVSSTSNSQGSGKMADKWSAFKARGKMQRTS